MAIPTDLNRIALSGVYRDPSGTNPGDIWEWAQVFWVQGDVETGGIPDVVKLKEIAQWKLSLYQSGGLFSPCGAGVFNTKSVALNVASGTQWIDEQDTELNPITTIPPLPVGVSAFLFGRSNVLGRQTRKWVPGIRADLWLGQEQFWDTGETALGAAFFTWASTLLADAILPTVGQISDVVWDPKTETMRQITQVFLEKYPRTKGSRQLAGKELALQLP